MGWFKPFCLLFIFWGVFACTKFEFGYQLAPRWISNRLDDAFDFKTERLKQIRAQISEDFKKNHQEIAKLLIKHIDEFTALSEKSSLSAGDFKLAMDSLHGSQKDLVALFKGSANIILSNLSSEEFKNLNTFTQKKFKEADEKLLVKDEFITKQLKTFDHVMDFLFDGETKQQTQLYRTFLVIHYDYFLAQAESRKSFLAKLDTLLSNKAGLLDYVLKYYSSDPAVQSEDYIKKKSQFQDHMYAVQYQIWITLSEKQKKYFHKNLANLRAEVLPFTN